MKKVLKYVFSKLPFKQQLFTLIRNVFNPGENIYKHLYFQGVFKVPVSPAESFKMQHYGFQLENDIFWKGLTGRWEKESITAWIQLCRTSKVILDIGANTGIYSMIAKTVNPSAQVLAFEPVRRVFQKLEVNNQLNNFDIRCRNTAVSEKNGTAIFYDTDSVHTYTVVINKDLSNDSKYHAVDVEIMTVDEIIRSEKLEQVDLIKIDVETHEPEVFRGFSSISKYHPTILVEVLNGEIGANIEKAILSWGGDYLFFDIDEEKGIRMVPHIGKSSSFNYLLCTSAIANQLKLIS